MTDKPTYEELEQRVKKLEEEAIKRKRAEGVLRRNEKQATAAIEAVNGFTLSSLSLTEKGKEGKGVRLTGILKDTTEEMEAEKALKKLAYDLNERVKELNCLCGISQLTEKSDITFEEIIQGTVGLVDVAWQYPKITCVRIIFSGQEFKTINFRETEWKQTSNIIVHGELLGSVEVYYLEEKPVKDEGPFLKEERVLINTIAERLGRIAERIQAEKKIKSLKEKYEDLYNNSPINYLSLDTNGIITECNKTILGRLGYPKKELIGKHMTKLVTKESAAEFNNTFPVLLKTGTILGAERQLVTRSGEVIDTILDVTMEYDEQGKPIKTRATFKDITERKQAEEQIHILSQELMKAQESERKMISSELHDRTAQDLSTANIVCNSLLHESPEIPPAAMAKITGISKTLEQIIGSVRDLSYELRPPGLEHMGLIQALSMYCEEFSKKSGFKIDFTAIGMDTFNVDADIGINLYRIVQEGLNNIRKHAAASQAVVKLVGTYPNIILRIEDDGKGFDIEERKRKIDGERRMGLRSMQERVSLIQGEMAIQSQPMKGAQIFIKLPYREKKHG